MLLIPCDDGRNTCTVPMAFSWKGSRDSTRETKNGPPACECILPSIRDYPSRSDILRFYEAPRRGHDGPLLVPAYPPYEWSGSNPHGPTRYGLGNLAPPFPAKDAGSSYWILQPCFFGTLPARRQPTMGRPYKAPWLPHAESPTL